MNKEFARQQMIEQQVRSWDVLSSDVLDGLRRVERELFVPEEYAALAFADAEIPIGHGEFMMTPTIEGRVLQALELGGNEKVLEIGTGSGFLTACLANASKHVTSIDIHSDFVESAGWRLADCGIDNVELIEMDGTQELPAGTFDAIAVTGSMQTLDSRLTDALNPGGRLFVVVGEAPVMAATLVTRGSEDDWHSEVLFETDLAALVNAALPPQFSF